MTKPGQFRVRLPRGLYQHLVIRARREGRSLNSLVVHLLANSVNLSDARARPITVTHLPSDREFDDPARYLGLSNTLWQS